MCGEICVIFGRSADQSGNQTSPVLLLIQVIFLWRFSASLSSVQSFDYLGTSQNVTVSKRIVGKGKNQHALIDWLTLTVLFMVLPTGFFPMPATWSLKFQPQHQKWRLRRHDDIKIGIRLDDTVDIMSTFNWQFNLERKRYDIAAILSSHMRQGCLILEFATLPLS